MKKTLLLINPTHREIPNASWIKFYDMPPMGLAYIATLTPEDRWNISIVDENYDELDMDASPDLVGISSLTYNINRTYELARIFRRKGSKVVLGGIHPSMMPAEGLPFADSIVIGEGESAWKELLEDFEKGELKNMYKSEPADIDNLVIPKRDLFTHKIGRHAMQISRGCPMDCEFCSVTAFNGGRYRRRPVQRILEEMETIPSRFLSFMDDNFGGLTPKNFADTKVLLKGMIERGYNFKWGTQTSINFADDEELLDLSRRSGCMVLFIGIESINAESMAGSVKKGNLVKNEKRVREAIKRIHDHGIAVVAAFILGNDEDDKSVFDRTVEFVMNTQIDTSSFTISTPYPGTRLFNRIKEEGRLLYNNFPHDWRYFNFTNVTYRPVKMSIDDLQEGFYRVFKETTGLTTSLGRAWRTFKMSKSPYSTVACYSFNRGFNRLNRKGHSRIPVIRTMGRYAENDARVLSLEPNVQVGQRQE